MKRMALASAGVLLVIVTAIVAFALLRGNPGPGQGGTSPSPSATTVAQQSPTTSPLPSAEPSPTTSPALTPPASASPSAPSPTAAPTASPTTAPTAPTASPTASASPTAAHGWQRTPVFWDDRDNHNQSAELRAILDRGNGERLTLSVPAIAIDDSGNAHVVWTSAAYEDDVDIGGVLYATNASGSWRLTELTTPRRGRFDTEAVIAVDRDGSVVVAFMRHRTPEYDIATAHLLINRAGAWSEPIEVPYPFQAHGNGRLVTHNGTVHLVFAPWQVDGGGWYVEHATYDGSWTSSRVIDFSRGYGPRAQAIGITEDGVARIGFVVADDVYVASIADGSVQVDAPVTSEVPLDPSLLLAFGPQGELHVVTERRHMRLLDGALSSPQRIFPRVSWIDGCGEVFLEGPSPRVLRIAADGSAHVVSFFDGPFMESPWYTHNRNGAFEAVRLYEPGQVHSPETRLRSRIEECTDDIAIDFFDPLGVDMALDQGGRPHVLTSYREYFVGPAR